MPRIKVDHQEPDNPKPVEPVKPVTVEIPAPSPVPDHSAIVDKSDPNGTNQILKDKSSSSYFSAFNAFPDQVRFEGEDEDETIILLMRAHIITNIKWLLITLGLIIFPVIFFPLLLSVNVFGTFGGGSGLVITLLWYLGVFTYAFLNFLYWYFNVYIVTNERVIDIDWYGIIYHKTDSTRISKIQEVGSDRIGVFASMFDFGGVHIQTSAEQQNFEFTNVPHPDLVSKKIQELMENEEKQWEENPNPVNDPNN